MELRLFNMSNDVIHVPGFSGENTGVVK